MAVVTTTVRKRSSPGRFLATVDFVLCFDFRRMKELEYIGVPWERRYKITSEHYFIECDSTKNVAEAYRYIMEALYDVYSRYFTGKSKHNTKSTITIYKTQAEFMEKTGMRKGIGGF